MELIVPDDRIEAASNAITAAGFKACRARDCRYNRTFKRHYPVADVHFHFHSKFYRGWGCLLSLFAKSRLLWWLPDLQLGPPAADDPDLPLSTDLRLPPHKYIGGTGPWPDLYPAKVLNHNSYVEALIWLHIRDYNHMNMYDERWESWLQACRVWWPLGVRTLRPRFREFWDVWEDAPPKPRDSGPFCELRADMLKRNELPPPPPVNSFGSLYFAKQFERRTDSKLPCDDEVLEPEGGTVSQSPSLEDQQP